MADNPLPEHDDFTNEIWREVGSAPDHRVSNFGRVRYLSHPGGGNVTVTRTVRGERLQTGYRAVRRSRNGPRMLVHRLVCEAFHGTPNFPDATVDHIDGDRENNRAENLEWVTRAENSRRQNACGRGAPKGENHPIAKLTDFQASAVFRLSTDGWKTRDIARLFTVSESLVYKILGGRNRAHASASRT